MADLADKIDDLICSFEGGGDTTMDTVAMLMFGWMVFGLFVLGIGKFIYAKYVRGGNWKGSNAVPPVASSPGGSDDHTVKSAIAKDLRSSASSGGAYVPPTPPVRKRIGSTKRGSSTGPLKSAPKISPVNLPPPATGPDPEAVHWVNQVFAWLYSDPVTLNELLGVWVQSLNESSRKSVAEESVNAFALRRSFHFIFCSVCIVVNFTFQHILSTNLKFRFVKMTALQTYFIVQNMPLSSVGISRCACAPVRSCDFASPTFLIIDYSTLNFVSIITFFKTTTTMCHLI